MGGWQTLCESTNVEADRAHFYRCMDQIRGYQGVENIGTVLGRKASLKRLIKEA